MEDDKPQKMKVDRERLSELTADLAQLGSKYGLSFAGVAMHDPASMLVFVVAKGGTAAVKQPGSADAGWSHAGTTAVVHGDNAIVAFGRSMRATFESASDPEGDAFNNAFSQITEELGVAQDKELKCMEDRDPTITRIVE